MRGKWVGKLELHRGRYRFAVGEGSGITSRQGYDTKEEAVAKRAIALRKAKERRQADLAEALRRYQVHLTDECPNTVASVQREMKRVISFLGRETGAFQQPTEEAAKAIYRQCRTTPTRYGKPPSDATHQACLRAARTFGDWLVEEGTWKMNPLKKVKPAGRAKCGEESKPQLVVDEARLWLDGALAAHDEGDAPALGAVLCLACGLRPAEAAHAGVRDVEEGGGRIKIRKSKTPSGRRTVPVPEWVRASLVKQVERARVWAKAQPVAPLDPPLFPPVAQPRLAGTRAGATAKGATISTFSLRRAVHRVCDAVGVRRVTTHSLRGLFASLAYQDGDASPAQIAKLMGHSSPIVAQRSYATKDSQAAGQQNRAGRVLKGEENH